jgi:hypothetical protein
MPDDAIGLLPRAGLAHAECALVHMLDSAEPQATEHGQASAHAREQRSGLTEEQWQTLLRAVGA